MDTDLGFYSVIDCTERLDEFPLGLASVDVFAQAVPAGAEVRQPLADMFWGDRHRQLNDPFGHRWNVGQHLIDVPHDEVVAAAARAVA
jgi:hypothetical protein